MQNLEKFIGIPFLDHGRSLEGADCLGLVKLVYEAEKNIVLPDVTDEYDRAIAKAQVNNCVINYENFPKIEDVTTKKREYLDVLVYKIGGYECHVALWLNKNDMLHLIQGQHSVIVRHNVSLWEKRLSRVYRYVNQ